jgi:hypothetical protein
MNWIKRIFGNKEKKFEIPERYKYLSIKDPKKPINFGIKTIWCAVKSDNHENIADYLNLDKSKTCNWIEGTIRAFEGEIFIIPSIENWVIIHGWGLPYPNNPSDFAGSVKFLNLLSNEFDEAHLYGNHRVSSSAFWMKSVKGELKRLYLVMDVSGISIGEPTEIERKWNLIDWSSPEIESEQYWDNSVFPGEEEVLEVSGNWSLNPMKLETYIPIGEKGIFGKLKNKY